MKPKQTKNSTQKNQSIPAKIPSNAQKAYKLLSVQEGISHNEAKSLIDIISNNSSCISKGIGKWTYIAGNKTDPPDAKPLMWVIRRYIIE